MASLTQIWFIVQLGLILQRVLNQHDQLNLKTNELLHFETVDNKFGFNHRNNSVDTKHSGLSFVAIPTNQMKVWIVNLNSVHHSITQF